MRWAADGGRGGVQCQVRHGVRGDPDGERDVRAGELHWRAGRVHAEGGSEVPCGVHPGRVHCVRVRGTGVWRGEVHRGDDVRGGYTGTPTGSVWCSGGKYVGAFTGCRKAGECDLPTWMCQPGSGQISEQYSVTAYARAASTVSPRNCRVDDRIFVKTVCSPGYALKGGTLAFAYCNNGQLIGGWAMENQQPKCDVVEQAPCVCGSSGEQRGNMTVLYGAVRDTSTVSGSGSWNGPGHDCVVTEVNQKKEITCFCRCLM